MAQMFGVSMLRVRICRRQSMQSRSLLSTWRPRHRFPLLQTKNPSWGGLSQLLCQDGLHRWLWTCFCTRSSTCAHDPARKWLDLREASHWSYTSSWKCPSWKLIDQYRTAKHRKSNSLHLNHQASKGRHEECLFLADRSSSRWWMFGTFRLPTPAFKSWVSRQTQFELVWGCVLRWTRRSQSQ